MTLWRVVGLTVVVILGVACLLRVAAYVNGLRVTSWFRSPWHNENIGGMANSLHLIGWAIDVIPTNAEVRKMLTWLPGKVVAESDHLHIQVI